jgi:hypothetical protein
MTSQTRLPRFSITGLMLFTLGIAGGVSASMSVKPVEISRIRGTFVDTTALFIFDRVSTGLWCSLTIWVATGLLCQAWDLRKQLHDVPESRTLRHALWFDLLWRLGVAVLLPSIYLLESYGAAIGRAFGDTSPLGLYFNPTNFKYARWLLLMIAIGVGGGFGARALLKSTLSKVHQFVAAVLAAYIVLTLVYHNGIVFRLVAIAINGVESSHPLAWKRSAMGGELIKWEKTCYQVSQIQLVLAAVAVFSLLGATFQRTARTSLGKSFLIGIATLSSAAAIFAQYWFRLVAIPQISPSFHEVLPIVPQPAGAVLAMIAIGYASARSSYSADESAPVAWRHHPDRYLHERTPVLIVALFAALFQAAQGIVAIVTFHGPLSFFIWQDYLEVAKEFLATSENYWPLAMMLLFGQRLFAIWRNRDPQFVIYGFSRQRMFLNTLLFALVGTAVLSAVSTWSFTSWIPMGWK